jgi:hypothetical protein
VTFHNTDYTGQNGVLTLSYNLRSYALEREKPENKRGVRRPYSSHFCPSDKIDARADARCRSQVLLTLVIEVEKDEGINSRNG